MDSESLWLQNSINLADPFDTSDRSSGSDKSSANLKDDLIGSKMSAPAMTPRSTTQFRSSVRMSSLCNPMLFPSSGEIDEMKSKIVQLQREKLKWEDTMRDLERSKAELTQAKEDYKVLQEYAKKIKVTADESALRAERDAKARQEAETKLVETALNSTRDIQQLKQLMDESEKTFSHKLFELKEEHTAHLASVSEENAVVVSELKENTESLQHELAVKDQESQRHNQQIQHLELIAEQAAEKHAKVEKQLKEAIQKLEDLVEKEREQTAAFHREMHSKMDQLKAQKEEEFVATRNESTAQLKVLTAKLEEQEKKFEKTRDDFFHARSQLQDKADQIQRLQTEKELEFKKLMDSHRSSVLEQKIRFDEEMQLSRSQFRAAADELGGMKKLNTKLEGELGVSRSQLGEKERELSTVRRELTNTEQRLESAVAEVHNLSSQLEQTDDLLNRFASDRDTTQRGMEEDLAEARLKTKRTEEEVLHLQKELSALRREFMMADVDHRKLNEDLSTRLSALQQRSGSEQSEQFCKLLRDKKLTDETVAQLHATVAEVQKKLQNSNEELLLEISRREIAEEKLEQSSKRLAKNVSLSPIPASIFNEMSNTQRSSSSEPRLKRARSETVAIRIFSITGFKSDETQRIRDDILTMPSTSVVGASNLPVPMEVTHMIARDALTIKLLTAAARGCWILPQRYVTDSCAAGYWLDEQLYGFQHKSLPFFNKKIAFTHYFKQEKQHYQTAKAVSEAGGAQIVDEMDRCDFLVQATEESHDGPTLTWDSLVHLIYPAKA